MTRRLQLGAALQPNDIGGTEVQESSSEGIGRSDAVIDVGTQTKQPKQDAHSHCARVTSLERRLAAVEAQLEASHWQQLAGRVAAIEETLTERTKDIEQRRWSHDGGIEGKLVLLGRIVETPARRLEDLGAQLELQLRGGGMENDEAQDAGSSDAGDSSGLQENAEGALEQADAPMFGSAMDGHAVAGSETASDENGASEDDESNDSASDSGSASEKSDVRELESHRRARM